MQAYKYILLFIILVDETTLEAKQVVYTQYMAHTPIPLEELSCQWTDMYMQIILGSLFPWRGKELPSLREVGQMLIHLTPHNHTAE